ncbi:MAG: hypothetical protein K6E30_02155 [Lachnospiraceae bacterium]|nr:hypothetical protein [Lachnospiraceae bacterium]
MSNNQKVIDNFGETGAVKTVLPCVMINWKRIVLAAFLCALAGAFVGGYKNRNKSEPEENVQNIVETNTYEDQLEDARAALTEKELLYVEQMKRQYDFYDKKLDYWNSYLTDSVLQNMDPNDYVKTDIQYVISSDNSSIINAFSSLLLCEEDYQKIGKLMGLDPKDAAFQELIIISATQAADEAALNGLYSGILNIALAAPDEDMASGIQGIVEERVNKKSESIRNAGTNISIEKIDEIITAGNPGWLINRQRELMSGMITIQANRIDFINRMVNSMNEEQKGYWELLLSGEQVEELVAVVNADAETVKSSGGSIIKYALAGGFGGLIIVLVLIYFFFDFSGILHTEEELCSYYKLPVLQRFKIGSKKSGDIIRKTGIEMLSSGRAADSVQSGAESLAAELRRIMEKTPYNRIFLACDCDKNDVLSAAEEIAGSLSKEGLNVVSGNPHADEKARGQMTESDAVILAETLSCSGKGKLKALVEECTWKDIPLLGYVTLIDM